MKTRDLVLMALLSAITAVCSQIAIPLPFSEVPFTLSILAVFLTGALLDKKYAFLSQVVYLLLGAVGIPVFAQFLGGIGIIAGPTGGYLVAYPIMAFVVALVREKGKKNSFLINGAGMLLSLVVCYGLGTIWLAAQMHCTFYQALWMGVIPFVAFDVVKAGLASALALSLNKVMKTAVKA